MLSLYAPASSLLMSQTSSDIQFGDGNLALLRIDIADCWLRNEYSVRLIIMKLEQVVTHWNAILFQLVYGSTIYRPVCLFPYIKLRWNYNPVEFASEASKFQYKLWENHDLTVQPIITYIYLCGRIYASCLSYFLNRLSVKDQKPNWNVRLALDNLFNICILSYTDGWCLVSFSINISCDRTHKVCLCFGCRL